MALQHRRLGATRKMNTLMSITQDIVGAFRAYDEQAQPLGLYGIREAAGMPQPCPANWAEWQLVLKPFFASLALSPQRPQLQHRVHAGVFDLHYHTRNLRHAFNELFRVQFVSVSKIKVRRYGDTHRIDPHRDFAQRWEEANLAGAVSDLGKAAYRFSRTLESRALIFLGFAKQERPFFHEMEALAKATGRAFSEPQYFADSWADPAGRGFHTHCAAWHLPASSLAIA